LKPQAARCTMRSLTKALLTTLPLHPWLFVLLPVVTTYAANLAQAQVQEMVVAGGGALIATTLLYAAAVLVFRDTRKAALLVSAFLVLFLVYDSVFARIEHWQLSGWRFGRQRYGLLAGWGLLAAVAAVIARTRRPLTTVTGLANVVTGGMLLLPVGTVAAQYVMPSVTAGAGATLTPLPGSSRPPGPLRDVYYLVFDRYGDASTIRNAYKYDNSEFYRYLAGKGFFIAEGSRSNYLKTALSLASSLNLTHLDSTALDVAHDSSEWAPVYDLLADHRLGSFLKAQGYSYVHAGSWWWPTRKNRNASRNINSYPLTPRPLMVLLDSGLVSPFFRAWASPWVDDRRQQWSRVNRDLAALEQVPAQPGPKFVFAHVLVPHPPYVFNRDGSFLTDAGAASTSEHDSYVNQLIATNRKIVALIDRILSDTAVPPIVVVQGDEGPYPDGTKKETFNWHGATRRQLLDKTGILNAYYLPGRTARSLPASITPVNSFRVILNDYFGMDLPLLPDRIYAHESDLRPYRFVDVTDRLEDH